MNIIDKPNYSREHYRFEQFWWHRVYGEPLSLVSQTRLEGGEDEPSLDLLICSAAIWTDSADGATKPEAPHATSRLIWYVYACWSDEADWTVEDMRANRESTGFLSDGLEPGFRSYAAAYEFVQSIRHEWEARK